MINTDGTLGNWPFRLCTVVVHFIITYGYGTEKTIALNHNFTAQVRSALTAVLKRRLDSGHFTKDGFVW